MTGSTLFIAKLSRFSQESDDLANDLIARGREFSVSCWALLKPPALRKLHQAANVIKFIF
jgi:hypothetical protein